MSEEEVAVEGRGLDQLEEERISQEILAAFNRHKRIVIFHHIRPDGDCLGSQFGLRELILANLSGKEVLVVGDSKGQHNYLDLTHDPTPTLEEIEGSLAVVVDSNYLARIELAELISSNRFAEVVRIDHHSNPDDLPGRVTRYVDPTFSACAEQIGYLAKRLGWRFTERAATYLYLGIYTDSNRFLYPSVSPRTLEVAKELWESGARYKLIHTNLTKTTLRELQLRNHIVANAEFRGRVIYFKMDLATQQLLGIPTPLQASKPNVLANIEGYPIWVYLTEERAGEYRVEFRSIEAVSVRDVALRFGGGGHKNAAGALSKADGLEAIFEECNRQIDRDLGEASSGEGSEGELISHR